MMKKVMVLIVLLIAGMWTSALFQAEAETGSFKIAMDSSTGKTTVRPGKQIRRVIRNGYTLTYRLMNLSERGEMVKMMGHHSVIGLSKSPEVTNHLMVYVQKADGTLSLGDVSYHLTGPDGNDFRTLTMGMYGGYGADVIMKLKGVYTIRTKIIIENGDVRLEDEFAFQVK